ncbi:MAG: class I SAM-dependent methyltransferase [Phycisphaerae bacterium]
MTDSAGYYSDRFSAERLRRCYEIAPPRVRQYFEAEIRYVLDKVRPSDMVLELGCGYGRVLDKLAAKARVVVGIDNAPSSLELAKSALSGSPNCHLLAMDAVSLGFAEAAFDVVVCIQNGISAFKVDQRDLIRESVRVTRPGGTVLFSSYAERFWSARLEWFELQAKHGLIGEIDRAQTRGGVIVCKDGFKATTVGGDEFLALCSSLGIEPRIEEVDGSSLFCEIRASDRHQ